MKINPLNYITILLAVLLAFTLSCKQDSTSTAPKHSSSHTHSGKANQHMHNSSFEELVAKFEGPDRDAYQKPDKVLNQMGRLGGKKIIDIGAGTGYFSTKLAAAGAAVIAADIDQRFLDYIEERKAKEGIPTHAIELRKVPADDPLLKAEEVDKALVVNTYHHIEDRVNYFKKVKDGLKEQGELIIVDFKKQEDSFGPPIEMRIASNDVAAELREAGYRRIRINRKILPHQYYVAAYK